MAGFKQFDTVHTIYGSGYVESVRQDCYVVRLTAWKLAQGQSPTLYLQEDSMIKIPGALPGSTVLTSEGHARIVEIRPDGTHIAKFIQDPSCVVGLKPSEVVLSQSSGFQKGDEVMTVYGQGYIEQIREKDFVVKLRNWALAQGQSPTCYLDPACIVKIHQIAPGSTAKTVYGLVKLLYIRRDGTHVCEAVHWKLADGKPPTLYLAPEAFALLSLKP